MGARLTSAAPVETGPWAFIARWPRASGWWRGARSFGAARAGSPASGLSQELRKAVPRFRGPALHPGVEHPIAILDRLEARSDGHLRLPASFFECRRVDDDVARHPFELEGTDQPLGPLDLAIRAVEGRLGAVRPA